MDKKTAINLLGGSAAKAQAAMGYKTIQAIYMWPDPLPPSMVDKVMGAKLRLKKERKTRSDAGTKIPAEA